MTTPIDNSPTASPSANNNHDPAKKSTVTQPQLTKKAVSTAKTPAAVAKKIPLADAVKPVSTIDNTAAHQQQMNQQVGAAAQPAFNTPVKNPSHPAKTKTGKTRLLHAGNITRTALSTNFAQPLRQKAPLYWQLMRLDKPIGILLLLWPTLWSLWLAAKGMPSIKNLVIFILGVIVMRSAGCVINDFADRNIDSKVKRTRNRPLANGAITSRDAIVLFIVLCLMAFGLVLFTDPLTIKLSVGGLILAFCYPFMKRHTHLPQVVLGAAFAWGIPMAYAAEAGKLEQSMWLIYLAVVLWTVVYDTFYAMVDRDDDVKIGVKSTAILFGDQDRFITSALQIMTLYTLVIIGSRFELGLFYYFGLVVAAGLFIYQQWLIRFRTRDACFKAFLNNNWVGAAVFVGIAVDLAIK